MLLLIVALGIWMYRRTHVGDQDFYGVAYSSMAWHVRLEKLPAGYNHAQVQAALQAQLDAVDQALSSWRADSEVNAFNRSAALGHWVACSRWLCKAVATALQVSALSRGAYDITVAPLVNLWGFGPQGRQEALPSAAQIKAAQAQVGWQHLHVQSGHLMRDFPVQLDLSSVGEGVGVDALTLWLDSVGVKDYMAAVAGTLVARGGHAAGGYWHVAIERPDASGAALHVLDLQDRAVSSSGSYRNHFEKDGVDYSHTIDPATGRPITHQGILVTVVLPEDTSGHLDATLADALSTAFNVLGPERGLALATQQQLAVFYVENSRQGWRELHSVAFEPFLRH